MRHLVAVLTIAALSFPAAAQGRGARQGQGQNIPQTWVSFDSLSQAIQLTDAQRAAAQTTHGQIDSLVRGGAAVRAEMQQELQRSRDRQQAQRFFQRLQTMQERADRLMNDLRGQLTDEQKTALAALRAPLIAPPRGRGRRPGN